MNKKRITRVLTVIAIAFVLSGCSTSSELITLETKFADVMQDGFFAAMITYPLSQAINWLEPRVGIFFAIAIVTIGMNAIVLLLTFKSNVAMQKMQELQPELQKIQAKYEGRKDAASQQRQGMEMQQLYAKHNVNPLSALVSSFIQFPLLIGMYNAVRRSEAVSNATFLNTNLSMTPSEAISQKVWLCVAIYLIMILCQAIAVKLPQLIAESRAKKEADAHHKSYKKPQNPNFMMTYGLLFMIAFIMLSWPTALSLYYCISSIVNISKTLLIDKLTHKESN